MSHQQQQHPPPTGKKRVEWSASLSSSEPQHTETNSPEWDSDSDNMLSYFLDGNGLASPPRASARPSVGTAMPGRSNPPVLSDRILQHPFRTDNFPGGSPARSMAVRQDQLLGLNHEDNDLRQPPPTPVIQHYFHSSSSSSSQQKKNNMAKPVYPTLPSGTSLPRQPPTHQFPFTRQPQHTQQQQQQHHSIIQQPIDHMQEMKQNFMGAFHQQQQQQSASSGSTGTATTTATNNHYAFQGYNASMEEPAGGSISPALSFAGDHEPLLLPGKSGVPQSKPLTTNNPEYSSQVQALAGNLHGSAYGIPNATPATTSMQPPPTTAAAVAQQAPVLSSQAAAAVAQLPVHFNQAMMSQKPFAPSGDPTAAPTASAPSFPQPVIGPVVVGNHPFFFPHHLTTAYLMQKAESAEETEEKRAKRLERNRESARKSRARKRERLKNLEAKVNKLYSKIERERRIQINTLETAWKPLENEELLELKRLEEANALDKEGETNLQSCLSRFCMSDTEQSTRKEISEFQYNTLVQHLLTRYQKIFLWTILQKQSYFLSGKEEHAKREFTKKITTGKISSKQLGEEISNGGKRRRRKGDREHQTACVSESEKFWPLVCFELSISVEQEEKFLEVQGRSQKAESLHRDINQIVAASKLASSAKECILYQIYLAAYRKRKTYNSILTPRQAILYQEWLLSNKDRLRMLASERRKRQMPVQSGVLESQGDLDGDRILEELRRHLEESLKVSKNLPTGST